MISIKKKVEWMDWSQFMSPTSVSGIITFVVLFSAGIYFNIKVYGSKLQ
jgi:hypothetical protein